MERDELEMGSLWNDDFPFRGWDFADREQQVPRKFCQEMKLSGDSRRLRFIFVFFYKFAKDLASY